MIISYTRRYYSTTSMRVPFALPTGRRFLSLVFFNLFMHVYFRSKYSQYTIFSLAELKARSAKNSLQHTLITHQCGGNIMHIMSLSPTTKRAVKCCRFISSIQLIWFPNVILIMFIIDFSSFHSYFIAYFNNNFFHYCE